MKARLAFNFLHSLLIAMGETAFFLASARTAAETGGGVFSAGVTGLAFGITNLVCPTVAGLIGDRIGRRSTMILCYLLWIIGCVLVTFRSVATPWIQQLVPSATEMLPFILMTVVIAAGMQSIWPLFEAWIADRARGQLAHEMHAYNLGWATGGAIGFLYAGFQDSHTNYVTIAGVGAVCLVVRLVLPDRARISPARADPGLTDGIAGGLSQNDSEASAVPRDSRQEGDFRIGSKPLPDEAERMQARGQLAVVWLANAAMWFTYSVLYWIFPTQAEAIGMSKETVGMLLSLVAWSQLLTFLGLTAFPHWYLSQRWRLAFQWMAVAGFGLISLGFAVGSGSWGAVPLGWVIGMFSIALLAFGAGLATTYAASLVVSVSDAQNRGTKSGIHHSLIGLGSVFAPFIAGWIAAEVADWAAYLVSIAALTTALVVQLVISHRLRPR